MKKVITVVLTVFCVALLFANPVKESKAEDAPVEEVVESSTIMFTDDCGRTVELPKNITKVAPSGSVATMVMTVIAPEYMTNVNSTPDKASMEYLPAVVETLPATGQLYGGKASLNLEQLIALDSQIIIDIGDYKNGIDADLDALQEQVGIPCIFLSGSLENLSETFVKLGKILEGKTERGNELGEFIDKTITMANENSAKIKDEERKSVMFAGSSDGLGTNAKGSSQAQVLEIVGCTNAIEVEKVSSKGNGNVINLEQLYQFDPDVIVFAEGSYYDKVYSDSAWSELSAVKNKEVYEIPGNPYCWLGTPPSLNMILGIWYLGNLVYPQYYDYDINEVADQVYNLFWGCDCNYTI